MKKGFALPLIPVIATGVIIASLIGLLVFKTKPIPQNQRTSTRQLSTSTPTPDASLKPDVSAGTANWKTYTNSGVGFTIKYPEDWQINECGEEIVFFAPNDQLLGICESDFVGLIFIALNKNVSYSAYKNTGSSYLDNFIQEEISISGREAFKRSGIYTGIYNSEPLKGYQQIAYVVNISDESFIIEYSQKPGRNDYSKIFELMVSTFQFLD